jgi:hypothetical protein
MPTASVKRRGVKARATKLVKDMPAGATWDDLMYRIYVRQKIESGLNDLPSGRTHSHASLRKELAAR